MRDKLTVISVCVLVFLLAVSCASPNLEKDQGATSPIIDISSIDVVPRASSTEVVIHGSDSPKYTAYSFNDPPRVVLEIHDVRLNESIPAKIPGAALVKEIIVHRPDSGARNTAQLEVQLQEETTYDTFGSGNSLALILHPAKKAEIAAPPATTEKETVSTAGALPESGTHSWSAVPGDAAAAAGSQMPSAQQVVVVTTPEPNTLRVEYVPGDPLTYVIMQAPHPFESIKKFYLQSPARLVVDLFGVKSARSAELTKVNRSELSEIRVGRHTNSIRVVLQFPGNTVPDHKILESADTIKVVLASKEGTNVAEAMKSSPPLLASDRAKKPETPVVTVHGEAASIQTPTAAATPPAKSDNLPTVVVPPQPKPAAIVAAPVVPQIPATSSVAAPAAVNGPRVNASSKPIQIVFGREYLFGAFRFILEGDRNFPPFPNEAFYTEGVQAFPKEYHLTIENAELLEKTYYIPIKKTSLTAVIINEDKTNHRVSFRFLLPPDAPSRPIVNAEGNRLSFQFNEPVATEVTAPSTRQKEYTGPKISVDFQNADIHSVLRILSEVGGVNIIVSENVKGTVTVRMENVPWEQVLDSVLEIENLRSEKIGEVISVVTFEEFQKRLDLRRQAELNRAQEEQARAEKVAAELSLEQKRKELEPFITETIYLSYVDAKTIMDESLKWLVNNQLPGSGGSSAGKQQEDKRRVGTILYDSHNNALIITDTIENVTKIKKLAHELDRPIPQVLIEARIVEATSNFAREIGVKWGGSLERPSTTISGRTVNTTTGTDGAQTTTPDTSVVNLPTIADPFGGIGANFGRIFGKTLLELDAQLTALETDGKARIISSPRIMTMNNKEAIIKQGTEIPVTTRTADGTFKTEYKDAALKLTVVPRKVPNLDRLSLTVKLEEKQVLEREDVLGNPHLATKEADTVMLLNSGETMVIGGIAATNSSNSERRVPCLGTLPILGEAFKATDQNNDKRELLMFITATMLSEERPGGRELKAPGVQ